jgi:hypothetical protein
LCITMMSIGNRIDRVSPQKALSAHSATGETVLLTTW